MDNRITLELLQAARAYRVRAAKLLGRIGLYPGQDTLLKLLHDRGRMTMGEAATALAIQPPTVTKMVNRLSASGLVRTEVVDNDRRKINVTMTQAGEDKIAEIESIWHELELEALNQVETQNDLRIQLTAIIRNLTGAEAKPAT